MLAGWVLASKGDMGVCWPEIETWVHAGWCCPTMETWACAGQRRRHCCFAGWVLASNGGIDVPWVGAAKEWGHGCVLGRC